eukprot:COSAG03_NODE_14000_length_480_cov_1.391076_1_plen_67_part_10
MHCPSTYTRHTRGSHVVSRRRYRAQMSMAVTEWTVALARPVRTPPLLPQATHALAALDMSEVLLLTK